MGWKVKVVAGNTIQKPQERGRVHRKRRCDRQNKTKVTKLEKNKKKSSEEFYATSSLIALPVGKPVIEKTKERKRTQEAKSMFCCPGLLF